MVRTLAGAGTVDASGTGRSAPYDPRTEGDLSTGLVALRGTGTGWLLSYSRFGCGGDRSERRQVAAQGRAPWLGERDLPLRT
jgi:hypothetical protein